MVIIYVYSCQDAGAAGSPGAGDPAPVTGFDRCLALQSILYLRRPQGEDQVVAGVLWTGCLDMEEVSVRDLFRHLPMVAIDYFLSQLGVAVPSPMDRTSWPLGGIIKVRHGCHEFFVQWRHPGCSSATDQWMTAMEIRTHVPEGPWLLAEFARNRSSGPVFWPAAQGKPRRILSLLIDAGHAMARMKVDQGVLRALPVAQLAHEVVAGSNVRFVVEGEDGVEALKDLAAIRGNWPMLLLAFFHQEFFGIPFVADP
jgi:hypothetical protein